MKILSTLLISLMAYACFSQEKELFVTYDYKGDGVDWPTQIELRSFKSYTLNKTITAVRMGGRVRFDEVTKKPIVVEEINETIESHSFIFKNFSSQEMFTQEYSHSKFIIQEPLNLFKWELHNKHKKILGYKCQKGTTTFRGRKYVAWFTTDLPFKAAPWKLHGLPGVVLRAETADHFFKVKAKLLKIQDHKEPILNPLKDRKMISWDEYVKRYIEKDKRDMAREEANNARYNTETHPLSKFRPRLEIILEKNRISVNL